MNFKKINMKIRNTFILLSIICSIVIILLLCALRLGYIPYEYQKTTGTILLIMFFLMIIFMAIVSIIFIKQENRKQYLEKNK